MLESMLNELLGTLGTMTELQKNTTRNLLNIPLQSHTPFFAEFFAQNFSHPAVGKILIAFQAFLIHQLVLSVGTRTKEQIHSHMAGHDSTEIINPFSLGNFVRIVPIYKS